MTRGGQLASAFLAVLLSVTACGGSGATTPGATTPGANATPVEPAATAVAEPTEASGGGGGGGTLAGSACDLLTAAEVEAATGQPNVEAQATSEGSFDGQSQCGFVSNGVLPVVVVTVTGANTNTDPNSYLALPGSELLSLNGADGVWMPGAGFVAMVIKHGLVVAVGPIGPAAGIDIKQAATALAQKVADRMP